MNFFLKFIYLFSNADSLKGGLIWVTEVRRMLEGIMDCVNLCWAVIVYISDCRVILNENRKVDEFGGHV